MEAYQRLPDCRRHSVCVQAVGYRREAHALTALAPDPPGDRLVERTRAAEPPNEIDNFRFPFEQQFDAAVVDRQEANEELFNILLEEPEFRPAVKDLLLERVYGRLIEGDQKTSD